MKLLALEYETAGVPASAFQPLLQAEAARAWELYQAGIFREIYFRSDQHTAILVLECSDVAEAQQVLSTLPLVSAGLIAFEVIPLVAYSGFARLFESGSRD